MARFNGPIRKAVSVSNTDADEDTPHRSPLPCLRRSGFAQAGRWGEGLGMDINSYGLQSLLSLHHGPIDDFLAGGVIKNTPDGLPSK